MTYNAFLSYSHAVDGQLAPAIQKALHGGAMTFFQLRAVRVFRDKTSLSANPALWPGRSLQIATDPILPTRLHNWILSCW